MLTEVLVLFSHHDLLLAACLMQKDQRIGRLQPSAFVLTRLRYGEWLFA